LDRTPKPQMGTVEVTIERNWAWLMAGNTKQARVALDQVLPANRIPELVLQDAILKMQQRDYVGALASADEVLRSNPEDVRAARVVIESHASQNDLGKGLQRLIELATGHPKSAPLHFLLGQWYLRAGELAKARKAFEAAKAADSKQLDADLALADLDRRERKPDAARQRLTGLVTVDRRNVPALLRLANLEREVGNQSGAIARYRAVLDADGSNLLALNNVAYTLAVDDPDEALKFAQKAAEIAPDNPAVEDTLGWIYYRKGIYSTAVNYLKMAVSKEPTPRRQFHLAMSYLKSGDQARGQSMLQGALQQDPNLAKTERGW
jgi:tetratricopeptide (TPR) repeat protein